MVIQLGDVAPDFTADTTKGMSASMIGSGTVGPYSLFEKSWLATKL